MCYGIMFTHLVHLRKGTEHLGSSGCCWCHCSNWRSLRHGLKPIITHRSKWNATWIYVASKSRSSLDHGMIFANFFGSWNDGCLSRSDTNLRDLSEFPQEKKLQRKWKEQKASKDEQRNDGSVLLGSTEASASARPDWARFCHDELWFFCEFWCVPRVARHAQRLNDSTTHLRHTADPTTKSWPRNMSEKVKIRSK